MSELGEHEVREQRQDAEQLEQSVVAIDRAEFTVVLRFGRPPTFHRSQHARDDRDLNDRDQKISGHVARIGRRAGYAERIEYRRNRVLRQAIDGEGPGCRDAEHVKRNCMQPITAPSYSRLR